MKVKNKEFITITFKGVVRVIKISEIVSLKLYMDHEIRDSIGGSVNRYNLSVVLKTSKSLFDYFEYTSFKKQDIDDLFAKFQRNCKFQKG